MPCLVTNMHKIFLFFYAEPSMLIQRFGNYFRECSGFKMSNFTSRPKFGFLQLIVIGLTVLMLILLFNYQTRNNTEKNKVEKDRTALRQFPEAQKAMRDMAPIRIKLPAITRKPALHVLQTQKLT